MIYCARSFLADPLLPTLEVEERFGAKQHRMTRLHQPSRPPWRLLGFSALLALAIPYCTSQMAFLQTRFSGRAAIFDAASVARPGWQLVIDKRAATAGGMGELLELFEQQVVAAKPSPGPGTDLLQYEKRVDQPVKVSRLKPTSTPESDPLFSGGPALAGAWADASGSASITLYSHASERRLYSGRLVGSWAAFGAGLSGPGFALDRLGPRPDSVERLVAVDASIISAASPFRDPLEKSWKRWEFMSLDELQSLLGPSLTYLRWRDRSYFSLALPKPELASQMLAKRFPPSVIPTGLVRTQGARIQGFEPEGPAWSVRGDFLLASRSGGPLALSEYLESALAPASKPSPFWDELRRLAASQSGWHLLLVYSWEELGCRLAFLARWPEPGQPAFQGFTLLETEPNQIPASQLRNGPGSTPKTRVPAAHTARASEVIEVGGSSSTGSASGRPSNSELSWESNSVTAVPR